MRLKSDIVKRGYLAGHIQFNSCVIKRGERGRNLREQGALQRELVGMGVEVAQAGKENLPLHAQRGADLDDLRNLLQAAPPARCSGKTVCSG